MKPGEYDKTTAVVLSYAHLARSDDESPLIGLGEEVKLSKAGALYADDVTIASPRAVKALNELKDVRSRMEAAAAGATPEAAVAWLSAVVDTDLTDQQALDVFHFVDGLGRGVISIPTPLTVGMILGMFAFHGHVSNVLPLFDSRTRTRLSELPDDMANFAKGIQGENLLEKLDLAASEAPDPEVRTYAIAAADELRAYRDGTSDVSFDVADDLTDPEAELLTGVLGGLPAFPYASWDVILDVRERMAASRTRLRAVLAEVAEELRGASENEISKACDSLRKRLVSPALVEIDEALEDLGAVPALLRIASDGRAIGSASATIALAAADPATLGLNALAYGVTSAPLVASTVREALHQRRQRGELQAQPFGVLREIDRLTAS